MAATGINNIKHQHQELGDFNAPQLKELVDTINQHVEPAAALSATMPIAAVLKPTTRRPIVNHPHYEHADIRERTFQLLHAYSQVPDKRVWDIMQTYNVSYLILCNSWCQPASRLYFMPKVEFQSKIISV